MSRTLPEWMYGRSIVGSALTRPNLAIDRDRDVVVNCRGHTCDRRDDAADRLGDSARLRCAPVAGVTSLLEKPIVAKLVRYSMASVVGVVLGQSLLQLCLQVLEWSAVTSN